MCGPKTGAGPNSVHSLLPRNIAGKNEPVRAANPAQLSGDADELDYEFTSPVGNSFHARPSYTKRVALAGLRIPTADSHLEVDDGYIPTLDPATEERKKQASQASALPPLAPREISRKTQGADMQQEHLGEDDHQTGHTRSTAKETETIPKRFAASEKMLAKTGAALRLEARAIRARERPQREHERLIQERQLWAIRDKTTTNETLDRINHLGGLKEWNEAKAGFKLVGVDILVGVYKLPEQTARQVMLSLEGAINTGIKTRNLILSRDTKTGELVVLPKPGVTNSITGKILGEMIGMFLPGGLVAKGFKGVKTYQQLRNVNNLTKRIGRGFERGLGSLLFTDERNKFLDASFGKNDEGRSAIDDYINGKSTKDIMLAKLKKAGLDMLVIKEVVPLLALYKTVQNTTRLPARTDLLLRQNAIDSERRRKARHGSR